ncbi:MAG TPA: hypothetical protein VNH18_05435 [Bryobacteraceae bacterium]|nr:hypothetical protein [Blastocatellia bacterium]HXJ38697.1 hypothetical protein [Bryobacteraceae bacterium]
MPTYNGWNVVTIPGTPPAPASIEFSVIDIVSGNVSPFTGQMQIYDWNANYMEASVTMPPLPYAVGQEWVSFLRNLKGIGGVFQFTSAFMSAYPNDIGSRYWRLKGNLRKWSISKGRFYGIQFDIREAI